MQLGHIIHYKVTSNVSRVDDESRARNTDIDMALHVARWQPFDL